MNVLNNFETTNGENFLLLFFYRIDSIPLSRPKGQIEKDFADGVLAAEIVKHYFPQIVDLRNYTQARNLQERMSNWRYRTKASKPKFQN